MARIETHVENIKGHLNSGRSITSWDAIQLYRCTRLSGVIYYLKDKYDMLIKSERVVEIDGTHFARYTQIANPNAKKAIKEALLKGECVDSNISRNVFNCDHLKVVINELQEDGMEIGQELSACENGRRTTKYFAF